MRSTIIPAILRRAIIALALACALVAAGSTAAFAASGPLTVGTDGYARFTVTPEAGAAQVWIEVEDPSISAPEVVVLVDGAAQTVTNTALGTIAIVPATGSTRTFAVALTTGATPDIAVTIIDGLGNILYSTVYQPTLVDYRTLPQGSTPSGVLGGLAATGLNLGITLLIIVFGGVAVLIGGSLHMQRARKAAR